MISCSDAEIELVWKNTARSTLKPINADLSYGAGQYDFLTCEFNADTAQLIRDSIELLNETRAVEVKLGGKTVRTMYFHPDNLKVGKDLRDSEYGGYLELHDLHEFLASGDINYDFRNETSDVIYTEIFRHRQGEKDPFTQDAPILNYNLESSNTVEYPDREYDLFRGAREKAQQSNPTKDITIDIESGDTPLAAIKQANKELSLSTYINSQGQFVVGNSTGENSWLANETGTKADYLLDTASISQAYKKELERVNIIGPIEALGGSRQDFERNLGSIGSKFNPLDDPEKSGFQLRAIVEDPAVSDGKIVTERMTETSVEEIPQSAIRRFLEIDSEKQTGTVTINMPVSNNKDSPVVGDRLNIPAPETCELLEEPAYRADSYSIQSIRHKLQGTWEMELNIRSIPRNPNNLKFRIGYIDNATGETYTFEDIQGYKPKVQGASFSGSITDEDINE